MESFTIGGVPEHFNLPWHQALETGAFKAAGIDLNWRNFPGGTGAMCQELRNGTLDAAIILTEGIIKDIIEGNPSKIVKVYVASPLLWGVHVDAQSDFTQMQDLQDARIAISRYGSGSQLMAKVNAVNQSFDVDSLHYVLVKNLTGGIDALTSGEADYFMWEHFTTKPLVDDGIFRRIENVTTPWPCFVLAVRDEILATKNELVKNIIHVINTAVKPFENALNQPHLIELFSTCYNQQIEDVKAWLAITEWDDQTYVSKELIEDIQNKLVQFDVIEHTVPYTQIAKRVL
ncbi:substrate-binding domain-containing protein [Flavobacteriaceae bacterium F08102]|nr:substrate-binding domain-containing protein [Flavobacteriaceae bacterium F08102]